MVQNRYHGKRRGNSDPCCRSDQAASDVTKDIQSRAVLEHAQEKGSSTERERHVRIRTLLELVELLLRLAASHAHVCPGSIYTAQAAELMILADKLHEQSGDIC